MIGNLAINPAGKIVCATRGGKASQLLQAKAINLAKAQQKELVFLYIVNLENLGDLNERLMEAARSELMWFGNALLQVAQLRAIRSGVKTEIITRVGNIRDKIEEVLIEKHADLLILGASRRGPTPLFEEDGLSNFARQIHDDTGVEVQVLSLGER